MKLLAQTKFRKTPNQIVIVLDWRAILGIFVIIFLAGWLNGYRQRGEFARLEAQNSHIIQLLEGAEITRGQSVVQTGATSSR